MPNISQSKGNQTMKSGQLIEYNKKSFFFFKNYTENEAGRPGSSRSLYFCESLIWGESKWFAVYFWYILIALNLPYNKSKLYKTLDYWSRNMLIFNFSETNFGNYFLHYILWMIFQKECSTFYFLLTGQISLSDYLYFSTSQSLKFTSPF